MTRLGPLCLALAVAGLSSPSIAQAQPSRVAQKGKPTTQQRVRAGYLTRMSGGTQHKLRVTSKLLGFKRTRTYQGPWQTPDLVSQGNKLFIREPGKRRLKEVSKVEVIPSFDVPWLARAFVVGPGARWAEGHSPNPEKVRMEQLGEVGSRLTLPQLRRGIPIHRLIVIGEHTPEHGGDATQVRFRLGDVKATALRSQSRLDRNHPPGLKPQYLPDGQVVEVRLNSGEIHRLRADRPIFTETRARARIDGPAAPRRQPAILHRVGAGADLLGVGGPIGAP